MLTFVTDVVYLENGNDDNHTDGQLDMDLVRQMKELKEQLAECLSAKKLRLIEVPVNPKVNDELVKKLSKRSKR